MRRNSYKGTSGQKSDPAIRSGDLDFLWDRCISTTEWRLLHIFHVFVLLRRIITWPCDLDLLTLRVFRIQCFSCPTHIPIIINVRLSVTELRVLNIWSHFRYLKKALRMRRVTWPLTGGTNSPHFRNPWPQCAYSFCHFQGATTKIKPCYRQKIAFSHYEGYKVYCACAVSRDLCLGDPKNHMWPFFDPELPIHYTTFMRLRWRLRVVYIWASPC